MNDFSFFINSEKAEKQLQEIAGDDPIAQKRLDEILPLLLSELKESPDPNMALDNLNHFSQMIISRMAFLSSLKQNPAVTQMILTLFGHSQFLSDALIRNPEYFDWFIDSSILRETKTREEMFEELHNMVGLFTTRDSKLNAMRRFKRREMLRIGLRDLMKTADLEANTLELSYLADVCLEMATSVCLEELTKQFGNPMEESNPEKVALFTTIGMGKLGGKELNYSSDIDVMFLYSDEGDTSGSPSISNHEFFTKLAQNIIQVIGGMTKEGYLFRIDARLRPEGDAGPLVRSIVSYENYYASFGATWERLALIKARYCAGDAALANEFLEMINPFIYHRYIGISEIEDLHHMKSRIDAQIAQKGTTYRNVKLGYGGIREIEFSVQLLQLLYGAKNKSLKKLGTLPCLRELKKLKFIEETEEIFLKEAYIYLRHAEHKLQIMHAQQLHTFPEDPEQLALFSARMGFKADKKQTLDQAFLNHYQELTEQVHKLYGHFFKLPEELSSEKKENLDWLLEEKVDPEKLKEKLEPIGFLHFEQAHKNFILLAKGPSYMHVPVRTQKTFAALLPSLIEALTHAPDPDQALNNLERFVLAQKGSRSSFFEVLLQNQNVMDLLLTLFGSSHFLSDLLIASPNLFGSLTLPGEIETKRTEKELSEKITPQLNSEKERSKKITLLKSFKNEEMMRISLRDLLNLISLTEFFKEYADLSDVVLSNALAIATEGKEVSLAIIGLGKQGGAELSYSSDLDMVIVSRNGNHTENEAAAELIQIMNNKSDGNELYKVDMRLRPDGDKGPLAPSIETYQRYYKEKSATWEKQSLTRARFICGDPELGKEFEAIRQETIFKQSADPSIKEEIRTMRTRIEKERSKVKANEKEIKLGAGGIVDIEFIAQYLQLTHGHTSPKLQTTSTLETLVALSQAKHLSSQSTSSLKEGYLFLRALENMLRIVNNQALDKLPTDAAGLQHCAKRMGYSDTSKALASEQLINDLDQTSAKIREIYLSVFS